MQLKAFSATCPILDGVENASQFFDSIKVNYNSLRKKGKYTTLPAPSLYIHQINKGGKSYLGLVASIDMVEYLNGRIIPHEKTITTLEEKHISLLKNTGAQLKPVMLAHRKLDGLQPILLEVVSEYGHFLEVPFPELEEVHRYWQVPQGTLTRQLLNTYQDNVLTAYVADGHHRLAANASLFQQFGKAFRCLPAAIYEEDQLRIYAFNRLVKGLNGLTAPDLLARISDIADITPLPKAEQPAKTGELTMFLQGEWFRLKWKTTTTKKENNAPVQLDVDRLNSRILEGVLGISDIRSARRVQYFEGTIPLSKLMEKVSWNKNKVLFCPPPIGLNTFFEISDRRQILPPKSTCFEPRIRSGILVREFREEALQFECRE